MGFVWVFAQALELIGYAWGLYIGVGWGKQTI